MIVGFRRHFLLLANICWRKADEEMEAVAVDARFQRSAVALADAPHARQPVAVGALVRFRGGKIGVDLSVDRIVDGEHEKPLVDAAAQTHCGTGDACRAFARVVEGVAEKGAEIGVGDGEISGQRDLKIGGDAGLCQCVGFGSEDNINHLILTETARSAQRTAFAELVEIGARFLHLAQLEQSGSGGDVVAQVVARSVLRLRKP